MKIAFYSPLKPPDHEVPSGDRLMARQLMACMTTHGYEVELASRLRVFVKDPHDDTHLDNLKREAQSEIARITQLWKKQGTPAAWFCYHPYYKSPDLIGPELCKTFGIAYITAEASYSDRRTTGVWAALQQHMLASIKSASVNICFTERDRAGLSKAAPSAKLAMLRPFINVIGMSQFQEHDAVKLSLGESASKISVDESASAECRLVTVAMMRAGDKMDSYIRLAAALKQVVHLPWRLSVVGDGATREEVQALFADIPEHRINWHGRLAGDAIAALFVQSSLYVWPGCGEAYGLAYLEAQAAGLPVVAYRTAGVPEVVDSGYSGILTEADDEAYAAAIALLIGDETLRKRLSRQAQKHVENKHSTEQASRTLGNILVEYAGIKT